jgi:hypothetical protein
MRHSAAATEGTVSQAETRIPDHNGVKNAQIDALLRNAAEMQAGSITPHLTKTGQSIPSPQFHDLFNRFLDSIAGANTRRSIHSHARFYGR